MRPYQIKYFNQGYQSAVDDLKKCAPIKIDTFVALLNDVLAARGEMSELIVHRDVNNLEMLGSTTEKFQTADALGHDLAGRVRALIDFANIALAAGIRIKSD